MIIVPAVRYNYHYPFLLGVKLLSGSGGRTRGLVNSSGFAILALLDRRSALFSLWVCPMLE